MKPIKSLSLIVPSYKQEKTIIKNIKKLDQALSQIFNKYEIIIVVDGFMDKTYSKVKNINNNNVILLGYPTNKGKGFAVRYGLPHAHGDVIGFIDAGMDLDPTGIAMLLNHMVWYNADVIVGSKLHPVSQVNYPPLRKILSWGYRTLTHLLFGFKVRDTQVGLKLFRKEVIRNIAPKLTVDQFAIDIEVLAVAYKMGYKRIFEAPVKLQFKDNSTITSKNFWKIIIVMLYDTLLVFYRVKLLNKTASTKERPRYDK